MSQPFIRPSRVKHFANIGDIIASLAGMKAYWQRTQRKIIYCQQLNVPADYYQGAVHPTLDDGGDGKMVMCNKKMFDMIKPLLLSQEYIEDVEVFTGQPINFDLDVIRKKIFVNIPNQAIQQWLFLAYPDLSADLSKSWIDIGDIDISNCSLSHPSILTSTIPIENLTDKIIINFTERYRNAHLHYFWLKKYSEQLIFTGTQKEYHIFCTAWDLQMPYLNINNFLELAYILKQAKFFMGNQSFCWNLCESLKIPRLLELCEGAPNCQPFIGEHSYGYYHQKAPEWFFTELMKIKK